MVKSKWFILVALCASFAFSQDDAVMQKAFIKSLIGTVEVKTASSGAWRAAKAGMPVKMGWDIRTYVESSADIEIETGTLLKIGENSVVTLAKLINDKESNASKSNIKIGTGKLWADVKKLTNSKSEFEFETPTAVAAIRGTKLGLSVDKGETQLDVYEGLVMVRPRGGAGKEVAVSTHNRAIIGDNTHAIRLLLMTDKDTVKGQKPMKDPFADTTKTGKIDKLLDTTSRSAVDTTKESPLVLDVTSPATGAIVKDNQVLVKGKASVNSAVDVAGKDVVVDKDGNFSALVDCSLGKNTITVVARRGAVSKSVDCAVEYRPVLSMNVANVVDNMEITSGDISIDVEVSDGARYSVNGVDGATKITLQPGKNSLVVKAWDQWGGTVSKMFNVIYTKSTNFSLTVATPKDQSVISVPTISVSGSTSPGAKVTVNNASVVVSASGFFTYNIPIPDEAHDYTVHVSSKLGDDEASEDRLVSYSPPRPPLTLLVASPVDGQLIKTNMLHVTGKTSPRAKVTVNSRQATVSSAGLYTCDIPLLEKDIGDYALSVEATDDSTDLTKIVNVKIDGASPQINTSMPTLTVPVLGTILASRVQQLVVNVYDKTPDDQITLVIVNNNSREELTFQPGDQQYFNLEEGKNSFTITAYDKAKNASNTVQGVLYYLPGPLSIDLIEPSDNVLNISDLPPMPKGYGGPKINVQVEVNDGIHTVPETIRYVRITDKNGKVVQMLDQKNYRYAIDVPLVRGVNTLIVSVQDIAENIGSRTFTITIR